MASIAIDRTDGLSSSTAIKGPCRVATTANIALTGTQTIDGVAVVVDDRVLVKDQTAPSENGIYVVDTGPWRRAKDFEKTRDVRKGTRVAITDGTALAKSVWAVSASNPIGVGIDNITLEAVTFGQFGVLDEDDMASDSADDVPTQQSVKAYVDTGPSTAGLQANMRERIDAPVYVTDLAALRALDTSKDQVATVLRNQTPFASADDGTLTWTGFDLTADTVLQSVTSTSVNSGTDTITKVAHGLSTSNGGVVTTAVNGLAVNTVYWVIKVDADNFKLATSLANALAGTAIDLTATTNFTFKQLRDPAQDIYIIKDAGQLDGSTGAWVRMGADLGSNFNTPGQRFHRLNDRLLVGQGATRFTGGQAGALTGGNSWLSDEKAPSASASMQYLLGNAAIAGVGDPVGFSTPIGIFGAGTVGPSATAGGPIGIAGYASTWATSGATVVWGGYFDAVKRPGSNGSAQGIEVEISNCVSTPIAFQTPYDGYVQGQTHGINVGSGGDPTINGTTYDADAAIHLFNNGAKFRVGILVKDTALTADGSGYMHALALPRKAKLEWFFGANEADAGVTIMGDVSDATHAQTLLISDAGLTYSRGASTAFQIAYTANSVNYLHVTPGATGSGPILAAIGNDTDISGWLRTKGTGTWAISDASFNKKIEAGSGGIGFFGTAPVAAKTGWGLPSGTLLRTTFASYAGQTHTGSYVQATVQALDDAVKAVSQRLAALITDLHQTAGYGLLRT